jgi:hypothetical protein
MGKKNTLDTYSNDNQTYTNMLCIQKEHILMFTIPFFPENTQQFAYPKAVR